MFERITHAIVGASGAAAATQFPAYFQQYLQRLGGARDEAVRAADAAGSGAQVLGLSVEEYAAQLAKLGDQGAAQAKVIIDLIDRADELDSAFTRVQSASLVEQPILLASVYDTDIGKRAWDAMEFALPLSMNGLVYALLGLVVALALFAILWHLPGTLARFHHWLRSLMMLRVSKF